MELARSESSTIVRSNGAAIEPARAPALPGRRRQVHGEVELRLVTTVDAIESVDSEGVLPRDRSERVNRIVNLLVASAALVAVAPLLALVAVVVKLTSPGPVLYMQTRIGVDRRFRRKSNYDRRAYDHGGKPFRIYKFRTMRMDAEADGRPVWASPEDVRATPIGGLLRRYRIDELPQLYNVIRGDMNIVGPRPERPSIFAQLRQNIPDYAMRQRVKPGITGWAQVNLAYDASVDDVRRKVQYDLEYLRRQGVLEDLRIMSMTIPVMLFRRGGW
jgi:lipopolysaccharide/colanic/teichoic acid biosynthesis glycosyltransferase